LTQQRRCYRADLVQIGIEAAERWRGVGGYRVIETNAAQPDYRIDDKPLVKG